MEKFVTKDTPIGTIVRIHKDSDYYGYDNDANPKEINGTLIKNDGIMIVAWPKYPSGNTYDKGDLIIVEETEQSAELLN